MDKLTAREIETVRLLALGLNRGQVAERMNVSKRTVGYHTTNAMQKLGASNAANLVHAAHLARYL